MFSLMGGYIKVCIQLFNDTTFNTLLVPIYLSDRADSKTGATIRICSPQRLLLFDVMKKSGINSQGSNIPSNGGKACVPEVHGMKWSLHFLSFFLTCSKSLWLVSTSCTLKYGWCLKGTKSL